MTEISRIWQGTSIGDAGPYDDTDWWQLWRDVLHASARNTGYGNRGPIIDSGVAPDVGLEVVATSPASVNVTVKPGAALVDGTLYINDADGDLAIAANASGNPRIDTIVLTKDNSAQTVRLAVEQGTPAATPVPPTLTQTAGVEWQIPLADIAVANGFGSLSDDDITSRHEWANAADGVYLKDVLNNSGDTLETGSVVVWDSSADRAVTTTTTENDAGVVGTWVGRTQDGDYGRVLVQGIGPVRVDDAYARGDGLYAATTAGQARGATGRFGNLGTLLAATSAAGELGLAYIDTRPLTQTLEYSYTVAQNTAGEAFTAGADRTVSINTEDLDLWGLGSVSSNQITLQPGRWKVSVRMTVGNPSAGGATSRLKLYNATGAQTLMVSQQISNTSGGEDMLNTLDGEFEITVASILQLRIRTDANLTAPAAMNIAGETEKYVVIRFERMI
jgi:hypothetical protein